MEPQPPFQQAVDGDAPDVDRRGQVDHFVRRFGQRLVTEFTRAMLASNHVVIRSEMSVEQACQCLLRNDPAMTCAMISSNWTDYHPTSFVRLGEALLSNTNCRDVAIRKIVLDEQAANVLAKGIAESKVERVAICESIEERAPGTQGRFRRIFMEGLKSAETLQELTIDGVSTDQLDGLDDTIRCSSSPSPRALRTLRLKQLRLSDTALTQQLADALQGETIIQCLHIEGQIEEQPDQRGRGLHVLYEGIKESRGLYELILHWVPLRQLESWRDVVRDMPALCSLTLRGFHYHRQGAEQYSQLLLQDAAQKPLLTTLQLNNGILGYDILSGISQACRHLTNLKLDNVRMDDHGFALLVDHWNPESRIQHLSLQGNDIGSDSVPRLFTLVTEHGTIESLNLSSNNFGFGGLEMIGNGLADLRQSNLTQLDLSECVNHSREPDNTIWLESPEELTIAMRQTGIDGMLEGNSPIRRFDFRRDSHVSLPRRNRNDISDEARAQQAEELASAGRRAGMALLHGIQHSFHIQRLLLVKNNVPQDIQNDIDFYIGLNVMGRYLLSVVDQNRHGLANAVWCHIFAKAAIKYPEYAASMIYFFLREQPTLVPEYFDVEIARERKRARHVG